MNCLLILTISAIQSATPQATHNSDQNPPERGPPVFVGDFEPIISIPAGSNEVLSCSARGDPVPGDINWQKEGNLNLQQLGIKAVRTKSIDDDFSVTATITILKSNATHSGNYTCTASNRHGKINRTVTVNVLQTKASDGAGAFIGGISLTIVVVTLLVVWIFFEFFHTPKNGLSKQEIKEFLLGNEELITSSDLAHESIVHMPYNKNYEIPENKLYVNRKDVLGSGAFGLVFKGRVNSQLVAVKTCKPGADKMYLKSLLMELKIMIYLGHHPNVIKLIGAATGKVASGVIYIIVECCNLGNLEKYLRDEKEYLDLFDAEGKLAPIPQINNDSPINTYDLLNWSAQIANGMDFLASKKVIHGDLACRNVLLTSRESIKITDFGLSRQLYDYANYVKRNMEPLPWRWMAYESLRELTFSTVTDVWSYGVTIWEIFSLGEVPYPGLAWNNDFMSSLENNFRLGKPKYSSFDIYGELLHCWELDERKRPSFSYWKTYFTNKCQCHDNSYTFLNEETNEK